jgi:hypothetical protein
LARNKISSTVKSTVQDALIQSICNNVADQLLDKTGDNPPNEIDLALFDPTGVAGAVQACQNACQDSNANLDCSKGVFQAMDTFDPTGLTGMVGAFI